MAGAAAPQHRFLVQHDYGMGALSWWITASSEDEILETFADVEIVHDPERIDRVGSWDPAPAEVSISGPYPPGLDGLRDKRTAQQAEPGYGVLAGAERVYLKRDDPEQEGVVWFTELGPDGRRLREVEVGSDGTGAGRSRWIMNPPEDLRDPSLGRDACTSAEFEAAWQTATVVDD